MRPTVKFFLLIFFLNFESCNTEFSLSEIKNHLGSCGLRTKREDSESNRLFVEADSIVLDDSAYIIIEPFNESIEITEYDKIDSLLVKRYSKTVLSHVRTGESYGVLYSYAIENPNRKPLYDHYVIIEYEKGNILLMCSYPLGKNQEFFSNFECISRKLFQ